MINPAKNKILEILKQTYPNAKIALKYSSNWELLVAVILSTQCTDIKVNQVTDILFPKMQKSKVKNQNYNVKLKNITPQLQEMINFAQHQE